MEVSEAQRLKQLEDENQRLKHLVADLTKHSIDKQRNVMMEQRDLYEDPIHFNPAGAAIQSDQSRNAPCGPAK